MEAHYLYGGNCYRIYLGYIKNVYSGLPSVTYVNHECKKKTIDSWQAL